MDSSEDFMAEVDTAPAQEPNAKPEQAAGFDQAYQELNNRFLRLAADFENFRKRQAQEREHLLKYGAQTTLEALLPVLDNLSRAQESLSENSDAAMLYQNFQMMSEQLLEGLKRVGLTKTSPKGEVFNPEHHEALSQVEDADHPEHTILQVYQDGYTLHDKVLRPARVVVSTSPASHQPETAFHPVEAGANPFQSQNATQG